MITRTGKILGIAASVTMFGLTSRAEDEMPAVPIAETAVAGITETVANDPAIEPESELPIRVARTGKYSNLFEEHSWYTPPPPPPARKAPPPVHREPTAPPLPYELLGSYEQAGSKTLYFLVKGDRVYDVTIGTVLDGTYSVDGVTNGQLMFTYLPLQTSQGLRLGEQQ
jgi:hypothetical protein